MVYSVGYHSIRLYKLITLTSCRRNWTAPPHTICTTFSLIVTYDYLGYKQIFLSKNYYLSNYVANIQTIFELSKYFLTNFVLPLGLEPRTRWLRVSYSSQLSYESISTLAGIQTPISRFVVWCSVHLNYKSKYVIVTPLGLEPRTLTLFHS